MDTIENAKKLEQKLAELEALLFIYGEQFSRKKAEKVLEINNKEELDSLIEEFGRRLSVEGRGLSLLTDNEKIQLVTKPQFGKLLESFVKAELSDDLTPASLETLSIILYLGPISRGEIDYRRGVNSSFTLRNLSLRGLIEKSSDKDQQGGYLYQASFDLLKHLGINRKEELPEYEKFKSLIKPDDSPKPKTFPGAI
ncbi:MAG: SMC-Scp complex subunit ScpB [Candidatus Liptonbacteria bacterium]|nr:SMC-Scp complex subunit ScpB [Parcubacteria group bacterium]MBI4086228.1 SMC-Scp complex subunit ScpB [Candidatus Liptonbacteria bacterium]